MTYEPGELVLLTWNDHVTSNKKDGPRVNIKKHTGVVKFIRYRTEKSAIVELETPAGKYLRGIPLERLSKITKDKAQ